MLSARSERKDFCSGSASASEAKAEHRLGLSDEPISIILAKRAEGFVLSCRRRSQHPRSPVKSWKSLYPIEAMAG